VDGFVTLFAADVKQLPTGNQFTPKWVGVMTLEV
jgi:hypothetical protein